ncbi:MAG: PQQ-binding-like beta-propeller repeat protein [Verrucomicrobiota bacterium]
MKKLLKTSHVLVAASLALTFTAAAENWPNWRGPNNNGSTSEKGFPDKFSKTENLLWEVDLPGDGASAPIVWQDGIYLTSIDESVDGVVAMKLDRKTGKVLWKKPFGKGMRQDDRSTYAAPSAVTDGKTVFFFSGTGDLVAYDLDGKEIWARNIQKDYGTFAFGWTFSTSPVLWDGTLYLQVLQRDVAVDDKGFKDRINESYLLAMDPATGKEKWRHIRQTPALMESREAFSTPVPSEHNGRKELLVVGGDYLTSHDPQTGKELWRWGTWNPDKEKYWRLVPSPVYGDGTVLVCGPKSAQAYGIKAGGSGTLGDDAIAWKSEGKLVAADVPTPLYYQGRFYLLNGRKKVISCIEPKSGKVLWSEKLNAKVKLEASPTGADGKIYIISHLGEVFVVKAGDQFELISESNMGVAQSTYIRSPIVAAQGNLFIRANNKLFCVGK